MIRSHPTPALCLLGLFLLASLPATANAQTLYGIKGAGVSGSVELVELNPATGAVVQSVGFTGVSLKMIAQNPVDGLLYGITRTGLYTISTVTGVATLVGPLTAGAGSGGAQGMTFSANGTLYMAWQTGAHLYTVDTNTGACTVVGSWAHMGFGGGLEFDHAGTLWMNHSNDELYQVNPATGAATYQGVFAGAFYMALRELSFNPVTHDMYAVGYNSSGVPSDLVIIDMVTFFVTAIGSTGTTPAINGLAWYVPPEPEIDLQRPAGTSILDGGTDMVGAVTVGAPPVSLTYRIENSGIAALDLTGTPLVSVQNLSNASASVVTQPGSASIAAGATSTFTIGLAPIGVGSFSFELVVPNSDTNEGMYTITVTGTGLAFPEIDLQRPPGTSLANGAADPQGSVIAGVSATLVYTIENLGTGDLTLTGSPYVSLQNTSNVSAIVTTQPPSNVLAPLSFMTFAVSYTVAGSGVFSFDIVVPSNDADESSYRITVEGSGQVFADVDLQRPVGVSLGNGVTDPHGNQDVTATDTRTYTIANVGNLDLHLTGAPVVTVLNPINVSAAVISQPTTVTLSPGVMTSFVVEYAVLAPGAFSFEITFSSDDPDEGTYSIAVTGTGIVYAEIDVELPPGTSVPNGANVDLLEQEQDVPLVYTFTIMSLGTGALSLTGTPVVDVQNIVDASAEVTAMPGSSIVQPGLTTTFEVTITPLGSGAFSVDILIPNDDNDESIYTITLHGTGFKRADSSCCGVITGRRASSSDWLNVIVLGLTGLITCGIRRIRV